MATVEISGATLKRLKEAHEKFCLTMGLDGAQCPFNCFVLNLLMDGLEDVEASTSVALKAQQEGILPGALANVH